MISQYKNKSHSTYIRVCILYLTSIFLTFSSFASDDKEYEFKAVFMIKMVGFITWPENTQLASQADKLNLCIADSNKAKIKTRDLLLANGALQKYFNIVPLNKLDTCNVLFISKMPDKEYLSLLKKIENRGPILTFSDTPGYTKTGVMINFYIEQQKIGFEINWNKMKNKGFKISSRVLKLARIVDGD